MKSTISLFIQEADLTMMLVLSLERATAFEFSDFLYIEEHTAGYKRPVVESDIRGFIQPFTPWVSDVCFMFSKSQLQEYM